MNLSNPNSYSRVKGILFDIDGTLYHQMPVRLIVILLFIIENISTPRQFKKKARIIIAYRKAQETLRNSKSGKMAISQVEMTVKTVGAPCGYVRQVVAEWFETKPLPFLKPFRRKGVTKALDILLKNGFKLGVFSDYPAPAKLKALGLSDYFSVTVSAVDSDVSGFKPNSTGFYISARKMGLKRSEIVYVGDRPEVDGIGALRASKIIPCQNQDSKRS